MLYFKSLLFGVLAGACLFLFAFTLIFFILMPFFGKIFFDNLAAPKVKAQLSSMGLFRFLLNIQTKKED